MLTQKIRCKKDIHSYGFLRWSKDSHTEQREFNSFISLGRDEENIIVLNDQFTSRRHCRIQKQDDGHFILQDMNSRNGTFLNGNRVFKACLKNNDRIRVGKREFIFSFERFNSRWNIHTESNNPDWSRQLKSLPDMAKTNMPVLINGPSGTGKEMVAKLIHRYSPRSYGPMISINCSALSESLIESEFFGHVKGSYTGALNDRKGAFLAASGGTLFLDEIGDLPLHLQPKLLRALEYQEIKPVGADNSVKTDVRIISATHQNLTAKVTKGSFRADLYFRLCVLQMSIPSLKGRMEDFDNLLNFFCGQYNIGFSDKAIYLLKRHSWPGNIRELKNTVARARALFSGKIIPVEKIKHIIYTPLLSGKKDNFFQNNGETPLIKSIEKDLIIKTLLTYKGSQKKTSEALGVPASTLSARMRKYDIDYKQYRKYKNNPS